MTEVIHSGETPYYEAPGELRRFGKFMISPKRVLDAPLSIGHFVYPVGAHSHSHRHPFATEVYYCVAGELEAVVSGVHYRLGAGDLIIISPGEEHYASNPGQMEMRFIAVHTPPVSDYDEFTFAWQERNADPDSLPAAKAKDI